MLKWCLAMLLLKLPFLVACLRCEMPAIVSESLVRKVILGCGSAVQYVKSDEVS